MAAQEKPFQLSLVNPVQIIPEDTAIKGIRINLIYGRNAAVKSIDLGLINHTIRGTTKGWQWGLAGVANANFSGFEDNFINVTTDKFTGFQSGIYNHAEDMHGFQFGLINYARSGYGLQIGLINIIKQGGILPVFPVINWTC